MMRSLFGRIRLSLRLLGLRSVCRDWSSHEQGYRWRTPPRLWCPYISLSATAAFFSFQEYGIPEERLRKHDESNDFDESLLAKNGWTILYEEPNLRVYRRKKLGAKYDTYEYRCQGTYSDISARQFLDAQNDVSYRNEWDKNIIVLECLDEQRHEQLIRWVVRYPRPMYAREYVYVRRYFVSDDEKLIVVDSEALPEQVIPVSGSYVRVVTYTSRMCVRIHDDFEKPGLDYILTYFDNPEANLPTYVYNWIVNQGGPYFVKQVYKAAKELKMSGRDVGPTVRLKRHEPEEEETSTAEDCEGEKVTPADRPDGVPCPLHSLPGRPILT